MATQAAVDAPRFHHQWKPDILTVEEGTPEGLIADLGKRGHRVVTRRPWSSVQAITIDLESGERRGGSDSRTGGRAAGE